MIQIQMYFAKHHIHNLIYIKHYFYAFFKNNTWFPRLILFVPHPKILVIFKQMLGEGMPMQQNTLSALPNVIQRRVHAETWTKLI
jgi:hypothetical protein